MSLRRTQIVEELCSYANRTTGPYRHAAALVLKGQIIAMATNSPVAHAEESLLSQLQRLQCKGSL